MRPSADSTTEIGILLPHARGAGAGELARRAEAAGFHRIVAPSDRCTDPLVTLAFAAAATERVKLATAGLSLPGRRARHVAQAARTLDELSGGRFALWVTAEPESPPVELTTGAGRAFDTQLDELGRSVAAAVPLLVAGRDRKALGRVCRCADGVVLGPDACQYDVAGARTELEERWREQGRGGRPEIVALTEVRGLLELPGQVAELAGAGATTVVVVPRPGDRVEELAAALGSSVGGPGD
ncbi:MAG TPA: LLM class flavin-dependent oxidoreductase [Capillimicrobium sp.]|nr:LLM class flavin-dependent oxidoreductase [Capillimicrobium sp.]